MFRTEHVSGTAALLQGHRFSTASGGLSLPSCFDSSALFFASASVSSSASAPRVVLSSSCNPPYAAAVSHTNCRAAIGVPHSSAP
jgi:hypothetical protein